MSNKDNIEGAFQDKFGSDSVSDQGWNSPREVVWDKIERDLDGKNNSLFGLPFYLLLGGLLVLLAGLGHVINKNNNLTRQVEEIRIDLERCASETHNHNSSENQKASSETIIPEVSNGKTFPTSQNENKLKETSGVDKNTNQIERTIDLKEKINIQNETSNNSLGFDQIKDYNYSNAGEHASTEKQEKLTRTDVLGDIMVKRENQILSFIPQNDIELKIEQSRVLYPNISVLSLPDEQKKNSSLFSISGGLIGSSLITKGSQVSALTELIDREYANIGSVFEARYAKSVGNKWSVSGAIGITNQEYITEYDLQLPYTLVDEVIENGIGYIDFEHSLPTSFGNTNTELRLRRADTNQSLDTEVVNIDFDTNHKFLSLAAPVSIDYLLSRLQNGFFVGVDFVPSYIMKMESGISSVVSRHSEIESVNNASRSEYEELNRFNLSIGAHTGYRYSITKKSGVEFRASYLQNIDSYFSSQTFSSRSHGLQLSAGYFFRF